MYHCYELMWQMLCQNLLTFTVSNILLLHPPTYTSHYSGGHTFTFKLIFFTIFCLTDVCAVAATLAICCLWLVNWNSCEPAQPITDSRQLWSQQQYTLCCSNYKCCDFALSNAICQVWALQKSEPFTAYKSSGTNFQMTLETCAGICFQ